MDSNEFFNPDEWGTPRFTTPVAGEPGEPKFNWDEHVITGWCYSIYFLGFSPCMDRNEVLQPNFEWSMP